MSAAFYHCDTLSGAMDHSALGKKRKQALPKPLGHSHDDHDISRLVLAKYVRDHFLHCVETLAQTTTGASDPPAVASVFSLSDGDTDHSRPLDMIETIPVFGKKGNAVWLYRPRKQISASKFEHSNP
eukprot:2573605-Amphidinium_carterae.1